MTSNIKVGNPLLEDSLSLSYICRICLQKVNSATSLFSEHEAAKEILDTIFLCFQIILSDEEYLPGVICSSCIEELNIANDFRLKCVTFENRFTAFCQQSANNQTNGADKGLQIKNEPEYHEIHEDALETTESNHVIIGHESSLQNDFIQGHNNKTDINFKCNICNKVLKTQISLDKHNISMHQKRKHVGKITGTGVNRRYHCTKCSYSTPHSQTLVNHMRRHDGQRPYRCQCGKSFTQSSSLTAHQKTHSNSTYYVCTTCGKQFKHAFTLRNHLQVHQSANLPCSICQKMLKTQRSLQVHMQRHYNIRNYNCEDCGATFVSCSDLLNHRKKHSSEKKAECHLCEYKTLRKHNLIMHLKRHAGEKAIKCELCEVTVYTQGDLHRHRRVHTREKPFPCPACPQRFSHSPSLNKHMRNVHGVKYKWGDSKSKNSK